MEVIWRTHNLMMSWTCLSLNMCREQFVSVALAASQCCCIIQAVLRKLCIIAFILGTQDCDDLNLQHN